VGQPGDQCQHSGGVGGHFEAGDEVVVDSHDVVGDDDGDTSSVWQVEA
jgi:hypothetical protein